MADFIMNSEGFGLKIYDRFPPRYREDDIDHRFALRRYLDACGDGGFKHNIDEWNGILNFANPDQATPQALPLLYEQYGLPIFNGIPEQYLRFLLPRLGSAWQKKGGLDVIEFVASALAGVRTNTEIVYNERQDVDINLRLEMDYALGDYFPDTKQLYRLLDKFLPFYLGMTIIYVYVFHDEFSVHGEDTPYFDIVTYKTDEKGMFYSSGLRPAPMLFPSPHGLNVDFYLNHFERVAPDPDVFRDIINVVYREKGSLASRFAPFTPQLVPVTNTDKVLNHNFVLHGGKMYLPEGVHPIGSLNNSDMGLSTTLYTAPPLTIEVDVHYDKVHLKPVEDIITPRVVKDTNLDHVVIKPTSLFTLNTGLVLNKDFTTNADNAEYAKTKGADEIAEVTKVIQHETSVLAKDADSQIDSLYQTFSERDEVNSAEDHKTHLTTGLSVCFTSTLNIGYLTLNSGIVTNASNVEKGRATGEDTEVVNTTSKTNEGAVFVFSPLLCMLTNTTGTALNTAALKVPDEIDTIMYRDGSHQTVFR